MKQNPPKFPSLHSGGFLAGTEQRGYSNPRSRNGGFPSNPVPMIMRLAPDQVNSLPSLVGRKRFLSAANTTIPIALPEDFRVSIPLPPVGKISKGMGGAFKGLMDSTNLHASILPSNPMPFDIRKQVEPIINNPINNMPKARNWLARITGVVGSAKNAVSTTAQNRSPL